MRTLLPRQFLLVLFVASAASAHPMGNFSVNRYARLEPSPRIFSMTYLVDFAEIPTIQEVSNVSALSGKSPAELSASPALADLAVKLATRWTSRLSVSAGREPLALAVRSSAIRVTEGAGGLATMKLEVRIAAPWPRGFRGGPLSYRDENEPDRLGWREIVVPGSPIFVDRSRTLSAYPADPTSDIPAQIAAEIPVVFPRPTVRGEASLERGAVTFAAPARPAPVAARHAARPFASESRRDRFTELVRRRELTPGIVFLSLLIAFSLGGLHALSPGHGKTVVAAYLVGSRGTARHALLLGVVVTASHTIGVYLLGIVTLALSNAIVPEKLYPAIQFLSGLTIVAIGGSLFLRRIRRNHETDDHDHAIEIPRSAPTASALLALGVSGGILPCPSALVVLLSAVALHRVGFGLVLIVAFSMGLAAVLSGIGVLVVRAGRILARFDGAAALARRLPAFSALLIGLLGAVLAARALPEFHRAFF